MAAKIFPFAIGAVGLCYAEQLLSSGIIAKYAPALVAPSPMLGGLVSKLYGGVILVNVVGSSLMLVGLSFIPGGARRVYTEKAKAAGDKDAEERYSLPKLYAEGFSKEAKEFNCHQRAHQQALETYTNFVVCSMVGGIRQPLLTIAAGILYIIARIKWATGYCTGDPINRYRASGGWGMHVWTSLLATFACAGFFFYHSHFSLFFFRSYTSACEGHPTDVYQNIRATIYILTKICMLALTLAADMLYLLQHLQQHAATPATARCNTCNSIPVLTLAADTLY